MKRKIPYIILFIILINTLIFNFAFCETKSLDTVLMLQIGNPKITVNGESKFIDEENLTKPVVINGRTLVPVRVIVETFGGIAEWEESTKSVVLSYNGDLIILRIDSLEAYLNDKKVLLDVAPMVINNRTMLPVRFIAESFNLGVSWDEDISTVYIIRNYLDKAEYDFLDSIPGYSGNPYYIVNDNKPFFKEYEKISSSFEYYNNLDDFKRCNVCFASLSKDLMPVEERKSISSVTPSGWNTITFDFIPGKYLYNRCHLIGFQLAGENANEKNLITGTRYLNMDGMLPFENMVADYVKETNNHVLYRATPFFKDNNLVANGVLLEGYSLEDNGAGICFCVYLYNAQPDVSIDYLTGKSITGDNNPITTKKIYRTPSGSKYHFDKECGGKNSYEVTLDSAKATGLTPCLKCAD